MNLNPAKYLLRMYRHDNPVVADDRVVPAAGDDAWRCVLIHELTEEESQGSHNIYVDCLFSDGGRVAANPTYSLSFGWDGMREDETPPLVPFEKPVGEPVANVNLASPSQVTWVEVVDVAGQVGSDRVVGLSSGPHGHRSWYVVFQRQIGKPAPVGYVTISKQELLALSMESSVIIRSRLAEWAA